MRVDDFIEIIDPDHPHFGYGGYITEICDDYTFKIYLNTIDVHNIQVKRNQIKGLMRESSYDVDDIISQILKAMYIPNSREMIRLMNEVRLNKNSDFQTRVYQRLSQHTQKIFDLARRMKEVDLTKISSFGLMLVGAPQEMLKFQISMNAISLLGMLFGITKVARKAAKSDILEIYGDLILSDSFDSTSDNLETIVNGASAMVMLPSMDKDTNHLKIVQRFFRNKKMEIKLKNIIRKERGKFVATCAKRLLDMLAYSKDRRLWKKVQKVAYEATRKKAVFACGSSICDKISTNPNEFKLCGRCKLARYCCKRCQKYDWNRGHKNICKRIS